MISFDRDFLTKEEVRQRLGLASTKMVDALIANRKIPHVRLGHRTTRIPWRRCQEALAKLEIKAIGQ